MIAQEHDGADEHIEDDDVLNLGDLDRWIDPPAIDVSDFAPERVSQKRRASSEAVEQGIKEAGYARREDGSASGKPAAKPVDARNKSAKPVKLKTGRRPTGRNVKILIAATQEVVDRFRTITAERDWTLGITLEKALMALDRELEKDQRSAD